jgi:hypothetical protein
MKGCDMSDEKPDWKEWKRTLSDKKSKVTKVPPPISPLRGGSGMISLLQTTAKKPDWKEWKHTPMLQVWQACALSLDIDPHSMKSSPDSWMADSKIYASESFPSEDAKAQFESRQRMLLANLIPKRGGSFSYFEFDFEDPHMSKIPLSEFAAWCVECEFDIPPELAALAKDKPQAALAAAKVEAETGTSQSGDDWRDKARAIADECFDHDTNSKPTVRDSLATKNSAGHITGGYCFRVMVLMQKRGIKGARGTINNPGTIMREALQSNKWWALKKK